MQCWPGVGQVRHETLLRRQSTSCGPAVTDKVSHYLTSCDFLSLIFAAVKRNHQTLHGRCIASTVRQHRGCWVMIGQSLELCRESIEKVLDPYLLFYNKDMSLHTSNIHSSSFEGKSTSSYLLTISFCLSIAFIKGLFLNISPLNETCKKIPIGCCRVNHHDANFSVGLLKNPYSTR